MVNLSELAQQWPWNPQARHDLSDKEILTYYHHLEDKSKDWYAPIYPCLPGYAFVGYRVIPVENLMPVSICIQIGNGFGKPRAIFGPHTDSQFVNPVSYDWTPLKIPITHRMCQIDEDELYLHVKLPQDSWGKVELLAQRFDDLPEEDKHVDYWYPGARNPAGGWIYTSRGSFYWIQHQVREVEYPNAVVIEPTPFILR